MLLEEQPARTLSSVELESEVKFEPQKDGDERQRCDFCGADLLVGGLGASERRKYCSKSRQSRASQGRIKARLAAPPSKRYAARLKFSDPLYFN